MNLRIEALTDLALQQVADEHTKGDASRLNTDSYTVQKLIQEKFAELIIRECADVVFRNTGPKSALNVLNHFGVKE